MTDRSYFGSLAAKPITEIAEDVADALRYGPKAGRQRVVCVDGRGRVWLEQPHEAPADQIVGAYAPDGDGPPVRQWLRVTKAIEEDLKHEWQARAAA